MTSLVSSIGHRSESLSDNGAPQALSGHRAALRNNIQGGVDAPVLKSRWSVLELLIRCSQVSGLEVAATQGGGPLWRYASQVPITYAVYYDQPYILGFLNDLLIRVP